MDKKVKLGLTLLGLGATGCLLTYLHLDVARREKEIDAQIEEFLKAMKVK